MNKSSGYPEVTENEDIISTVIKQNISNTNFFIQKAEVEIINGENTESFLASVKYIAAGTYLISLRGKSGIEAARIYITPDTVLVNERINRQLLFGKPAYLEKKFGIPVELVPIVFGDFITGNKNSENVSPCENDRLKLERNVQGVNIIYTVDCRKGKIISATREGSINGRLADFKYGKFLNEGEGFFPSEIQLDYLGSIMKIRIVKFESPWEGSIEFIPGNNYEQIELL